MGRWLEPCGRCRCSPFPGSACSTQPQQRTQPKPDESSSSRTPLPLTDAQRGLKRCTADEVKERKRAQYRRVPGGSEKAAWPLPGHAVGEPTGRDEVPYRGVVSGQWRRGLWLDHVASALDTPLWIAHRQTWSLREEMFLQWAEQERIDIVAWGAQPPGSSLTAKELRVKSGRSDVVNVALNQFM